MLLPTLDQQQEALFTWACGRALWLIKRHSSDSMCRKFDAVINTEKQKGKERERERERERETEQKDGQRECLRFVDSNFGS